MSDKTAGVTGFGYGDDDQPLFRVAAGQDAKMAMEQASAIMTCVKRMTLLASTDGEANLGWGAHLLSDMAKAVIDDVELGRNRQT
ncbi:DUF3077 domain-containing protein [Pseudomonas xanthosomatis]|uniref:DUF3077 domain-containing protein n=1 Tax=Pseudomonas TaxID=286 RepID=UPI001C3E00CE|nr:DUF3077 domain-containing protein [Pseudomonas xanthosomatis]QXH46078.1 DUF3077 domain-containing protein [Pseudomonas xanthosomatis]